MGSVLEVGVWHGDTFIPMAELAFDYGEEAHAVDSFRGMSSPSSEDVDERGEHRYPRGSLDVGGSAELRGRAAHLGNVRIWEGWVPAVFSLLPSGTSFSFVHVDLDHYWPTFHALSWVWSRLSVGGVVVVHDWFPTREVLSSGGVKEWMRATGVVPAGELSSRHVWFRRE